MTKKEIQEKLKNTVETDYNDEYDCGPFAEMLRAFRGTGYRVSKAVESKEIEGILFERVENTFPGSDDSFVTFKVGNSYFQIQGTYDSEDSFCLYEPLQNFYEVKPVQKMVTIFEPIED